MRVKEVANEPMLLNPTALQISATERSVVRSMAAARSSRRVSRYACGLSPKVLRNSRLKWAGDRPAARARSATVSASPYRASARSLARSRWRAGGSELIAAEYGRSLRADVQPRVRRDRDRLRPVDDRPPQIDAAR